MAFGGFGSSGGFLSGYGGSGGVGANLIRWSKEGGISLTLDSFMISSLSRITNSPSSASSPIMACTSYEFYLETNDAIFALLLGLAIFYQLQSSYSDNSETVSVHF